MSAAAPPGVSVGAAARVLVVDGSRVARRLIERVLASELPGSEVVGCDGGGEALRRLDAAPADLVSTALRLPDMDGLELARRMRERPALAGVPIIVVSGDVQERLVARTLSSAVTDYFDKSLGLEALAAFIHGYVRPAEPLGGRVLYVEDSRVVALATRRMLEKYGFEVVHVTSVEAALEHLGPAGRAAAVDLVLTDVSLKGELTGGDLLERVRGGFGYAKGELPVLVMTGDDDPGHQAALLRAGANDLVHKPVEERLLVRKLQFQLRVARRQRKASPA